MLLTKRQHGEREEDRTGVRLICLESWLYHLSRYVILGKYTAPTDSTSIYSVPVPGNVLGSNDISVNKTAKIPALEKLIFQ